MQFVLFAVLPVLTMTALLAAAIVYGDGAAAAGANTAWTAPTFPPMCGP